MASTSNPDHHTDMENTPKSQFHPTVCLTDWWLVKTETDFQGRRELAVAGFTSREKQAMRVFSSSPILKRYDMFTIETKDGKCVILQGFINRDRTVENGFPSDVFNHFLFGFPPYWKEYVEKFLVKESSSKDASGFNPQSGTMEGEQPHLDYHEKDLGSQDKTYIKRQRKCKKTYSSAVSPTKKSDSVISGSRKKLSLSCTPSRCLEKESYNGGPTVEDNSTLDMPVNCETNKMESLNINVPAVTDKAVDDPKIHDIGGILSACRLTRSKKAIDNLRIVKLDKRKSRKANFERDMNLSEDILSQSMGRVSTRSMSSLKMNQKNNQTSVRISVGEKIANCVSSMGPKIVEFANVDREPGSTSIWDFEVSGVRVPTDKIEVSNLDVGSVTDKSEQISRTPNKDKDLRKADKSEQIYRTPNKDKDLGKVKTAGRKKAKNTTIVSLSTVANANNQTDDVFPDVNGLSEKRKGNGLSEKKKGNGLSEKKKTSAMKTRSKLAFETPIKEKTKVPSASPQSTTSFKRSRSGRLLMPTLKFWRNQRAIYNADGTITGIEGMQP